MLRRRLLPAPRPSSSASTKFSVFVTPPRCTLRVTRKQARARSIDRSVWPSVGQPLHAQNSALVLTQIYRELAPPLHRATLQVPLPLSLLRLSACFVFGSRKTVGCHHDADSRNEGMHNFRHALLWSESPRLSQGPFTRGAMALAPPKKSQTVYPPILDTKARRGRSAARAASRRPRPLGLRSASHSCPPPARRWTCAR